MDSAITGMMKNGTLDSMWDEWFLQPIPPTNKRVNLPLGQSTQTAWKNPNDLPLESYLKK